MNITTNNIIELIEDYTNTTEVSISMVTRKNGKDYQIWDRSNPNIDVANLPLLPDLSFNDGDLIMFYYTDKEGKTIGLNTIYVNELVAYNNDNKQEFIKRYKLPRLQRQLESYVENEEYDYAIQNRDFINHLKGQL